MDRLRKAVGYTLLLLSCLAFAAMPVIPLLDYEPEQLVALAGGLYIFGEVIWWVDRSFHMLAWRCRLDDIAV